MQAPHHLYWIPLLPLLGAAINLTLGHWLSRRWVEYIACAAVGLAGYFAIAAIAGDLWPVWKAQHAGGTVQLVDHAYTWIRSGTLTVELSFLLDPLSAVMIFIVTFVGFLIHVYSIGYMAHDKRYAAYFGYLNLFTGAMLILVLGDSLPVLFIGWEGVGLCSYLLIGFWFDKTQNADAGRKAFVTNRIGDFGFLLGIFLLFAATGKLDFAGLRTSDLALPVMHGWGMPVAFWAALLLFVGACGKSAQIPLYVWLPDAMAGPTPVSALIHAATMVTAGVYMVARLNFLYMAAPAALAIVAGVGALTALFAAIIGFAQTDIKKVLAYSTISQLGFMFVGVGTGVFSSGIFHLFTHAFFKAGLFLAAGSVMHAMSDSTDILKMGGLRKKTPITHAVFFIYCLAIAGIPPFSGFFSKDEILLSAYTAHLPGWPIWYGKLLWAVLSVAAAGTAFYMWRLYFLVFAAESRADEHTKQHIHESPAIMTVPLIVLALGAAILGFLGMPHVFHAPNYFAEWLLPSVQAQTETSSSPGLVWLLMATATLAGAGGIAIAAVLYRKGPEGAAGVARALNGLVTAASRKFYVDEIYDFILIRPFRYLATALYEFIDKFVIDLVLVRGSAFVVDLGGRVARWWQNGDVQRYLWAMVVGFGLIVYFTTCSYKPDFSVAEQGTAATLVANVEEGTVADAKTRLEWDVTGDGKPDAEYSGQRQVTHDFGAPGKYPVTLWITDGVFGKTKAVHHTVKIGGAR